MKNSGHKQGNFIDFFFFFAWRYLHVLFTENKSDNGSGYTVKCKIFNVSSLEPSYASWVGHLGAFHMLDFVVPQPSQTCVQCTCITDKIKGEMLFTTYL